MLGLDVTLTARTGDSQQLHAKAQPLSGVNVAIEEEDI
jgi:hypothetical protein